MSRKAQAAMEFLMTYGWAILVVLVVMGALTYFGVLNPQTFIPSRCVTGEIWMGCKDYKLNAGTDVVTIVLENNWQYDIKVTDLRVEEAKSDGFICFVEDVEIIVVQGAEVSIDTDSCSPSIGSTRIGRKVKAELNVTWKRDDVSSAISHASIGSIIAQIE